MLPFIILSIGEIVLGLFIYVFFGSQRARRSIFYKKWLDLDAILFDLEKDVPVIKKADKIVLLFCLSSALITLINGLLHVLFSLPDLKTVVGTITFVAVLPLRYIYIIKNT